jgi:hypothetical protein
MPSLIEIFARRFRKLFNAAAAEADPPTPVRPPDPIAPKPDKAPEDDAPTAMTLPGLDDEEETAVVLDLGNAQPEEKPKNITVRNKIGFHTGPGGNATRAGRLDACAR